MFLYLLALCARVENSLTFIGGPELQGGVRHHIISTFGALPLDDGSFDFTALFLLFPFLLSRINPVNVVKVQHVM
jgi:hypothetical protein